jgi:hypothetical protein
VESNRGGLYRGAHNLLLFVSKEVMNTYCGSVHVSQN